MRRIALSLVTIFAVVAMVAGATKAVFSTSGTVAGNSVSTATLSLVINKYHKPLSVSNLVPGQVLDWAWMDVMNTGPVALNYYFYLDNATASPDWNLWNNLKITLVQAGSTPDQDIHPEKRCTAADSVVLYDGPVSTHYGFGNKFQTRVGLPAGWAQRICQRVYLDQSVGNDVQGRTTGFDEVMYAEQSLP